MTKSEVIKSIAAIHDKADRAIKEIIELQERMQEMIKIRNEMIMDAVFELECLNEDIEDMGVQDSMED